MKIPFKRYWTLLSTYLRNQWTRVAVLMALLLINIVLRLLNPQIMRAFIDAAMKGGASQDLLGYGIAFLTIALVTQALAVFSKYTSEMVAWTATNALRLDLLKHCLNLDQAFHKAHKPGELIERIDGDVDTLSNFFSRFVTNILANFILLCGILIILYVEDWRVGVGLTTFAGIGLVVMVITRKIAIPYWTKVRKIQADFYGFLGEQLTGTEEIKANGATEYVMWRFFNTLRQWLPVDIKANLAGYSMWMSGNIIFTIGMAIAFSLGAFLWYQGAMTIGTVYLIVTYTDLLRGPMSEIRTQLADLQRSEASMARIEKLTERQPRIVDGHVNHLPAGPLSVHFDNVSFAYQDEIIEEAVTTENAKEADMVTQAESTNKNNEMVFRNLSFVLPPGRVLGLLGRTGSGKTTLARLLVRFHDPTEGAIQLDQYALTDLTINTLRQRVGIVTQEVQLFQASIRDNVTFFDDTIPDERVLEVFSTLGLSQWLADKPAGLQTVLTSGGGGLSAGQAQLLALARIFLLDPGLVILDEASSRLDPMTEYLMEQAIDKLLDNRTAIIIAHHLGTIHRADDIMILEGGTILEYGDRAGLAADKNSQFYELLQSGMEQMLV
jgi:ATP-binding cassette subfamily B protein